MKNETEFSLVDFFYLENDELPLKKRVDEKGFYAPVGEGASCGVAAAESLIPSEPLKPGEQYRFHFDMSRCVGCQCCVVACNEQNNNPPEVNWRRVGEIEGGIYPQTKRYHLSMACNHCLDPSCLTGCPTDAYVKLENGIVKHKTEECIGCGYCSWNCPYGVPQFNPDRRIVTKCDMCHGRLAEGLEPACVAACPEQAIRIEKVSVEEWRKNHAQADAPHLPESGITISTTRITLPKEIPQEMLKANRHRLEPEKPHPSLIFMTVLTQLAAGGFLTLWLGNLLHPLQNFLGFGAAGMLAVTALALSASVFHLGRPFHAYKALRMWKRSWLSREVLFFSLFSFLGGGFAAVLLAADFFSFSLSWIFQWGWGGAVSLLGMAGVFASAKIYRVPARPAWNSVRTPLRFFLTGFILGPLFGFVVYSIYLLTHSVSRISSFETGLIARLIFVSGVASFFQLIVMFTRFGYLSEKKSIELYDSTLLLLRRFRSHFFVRIGILMLGSFVFPTLLFYFLGNGQMTSLHLFLWGLAAFILSLGGELLGRYLFFVTVVAKNMPGSFFATNGSRHG